MGLSLRGQALSLLLAFALGLGLGLLYDLFRPVRRRGGDALWDGLFCLCAACLAFLSAMRAESGVLGTGKLLLSLLGMLSYFHFFSPVCLPALEALFSKLEYCWQILKFLQKKLLFLQKNSFKIHEDDL